MRKGMLPFSRLKLGMVEVQDLPAIVGRGQAKPAPERAIEIADLLVSHRGGDLFHEEPGVPQKRGCFVQANLLKVPVEPMSRNARDQPAQMPRRNAKLARGAAQGECGIVEPSLNDVEAIAHQEPRQMCGAVSHNRTTRRCDEMRGHCSTR
jgi:hypothetical protein